MKITKNFNHDLYRRIREAREKIGLPVANLNKHIEDHELIGKKMYSSNDKCFYTVDRVHEMWYNGWFEVLMLLDNNRSNRTIYWRNISCMDKLVLEGIDESRADLFFIKEDGKYVREL